MFGFDKPEDGALERYWRRIELWAAPVARNLSPRVMSYNWRQLWIDAGQRASHFSRARFMLRMAQHHAWWIVHNCMAHPLIGLVPIKIFFDFHDWTSHKLNPDDDEA